MKPLCIALFLGSSLLTLALPAGAGNLPVITEVTETMIAASSLEMFVECGMLGSGKSTNLQFSSFVNPQDRSFTDSLLEGQSYLGQPLSLTTVATFDPKSEAYSWTTDGSFGGNTFSSVGSGSWIGDPEFPAETTITYGGKKYKGEGIVDVDNTTSKARNFVFTDPDGKKWGPASGTDKFENGKWVYDLHVGPNNAFPQGMSIRGVGVVPFPNGGAGSFQLQLTAVPEPSSLLLAGSGVVGLCSLFRKQLFVRT